MARTGRQQLRIDDPGHSAHFAIESEDAIEIGRETDIQAIDALPPFPDILGGTLSEAERASCGVVCAHSGLHRVC